MSLPKSSVASTSTNPDLVHTSHHGVDPVTARSSWIRRLKPLSTPPPITPILNHKHTSSTHESRTRIPVSSLNTNSAVVVHRYLASLSRMRPITQPRQETQEVVAGFGPFQVRTRSPHPQPSHQSLPHSHEVSDGHSTGFRLSPFFKFLPENRAGAPVGQGNTQLVNHDPGSSRNPNHLALATVEDNRAPSMMIAYPRQRESADGSTSRRPSGQIQQVGRSRGGDFHERMNRPAVRGNYTGLHAFHHSTIQPQPQRQAPAFPNEPEEPFSYWNMGRFKKMDSTSSVAPSIALPGSRGRKRNPVALALTSSKFRRLDGGQDQ